MEYTSASMATLVSVITLVLTGQPLTPVNIFMLVSFINLLRLTICLHLAYGLLETYEAFVTLGRVEEFLLLENLPSICPGQADHDRSNTDRKYSNSKRNSEAEHPEESQDVCVLDTVKDQCEPVLRVSSLTTKQMKREDQFILQDIEFSAAPESLTVITGPVGSGKSVLLSAIAGEVSNTSGIITCKGNLAYVPQIPWVFSGTIRENILFGGAYDEVKYTKIIEACSLKEDIQQFPDCDETIVGERGEVLSGGQRARVSLARAVYADADLYLLDDTLSAVDFKVGQHIFEKCFKGLLGDKTRVITSHQEQHMKEADNVIVLYKGRVLGKGSLSKLKERGILNKAVDPLFKKLKEHETDSGIVGRNEENDDVADSCVQIGSVTNKPKGLQISEEDRSIGVLTSKLYWDYFRSGVPTLVIISVIGLCLFTQGNPQPFFLTLQLLFCSQV